MLRHSTSEPLLLRADFRDHFCCNRNKQVLVNLLALSMLLRTFLSTFITKMRRVLLVLIPLTSLFPSLGGGDGP
eukprot:scaffold322590_cov13-Tisochrysis_lutea.AAC.1